MSTQSVIDMMTIYIFFKWQNLFNKKFTIVILSKVKRSLVSGSIFLSIDMPKKHRYSWETTTIFPPILQQIVKCHFTISRNLDELIQHWSLLRQNQFVVPLKVLTLAIVELMMKTKQICCSRRRDGNSERGQKVKTWIQMRLEMKLFSSTFRTKCY